MKFIKKVSKPVKISDLMLAGMSSYDPHRGTEELHVSDMTKETEFCPREYAIHDRDDKAIKGMGVNASMRYTYDMGRDIEARVQNEYLRDLAVGDWTCTSCGATRNFCKAPKNGCEREDIRCNWRYSEVRLKIPPMTAGIDLLVDVGKPKLRLVELKSIIKEQFAELKAPLAEHRLRTAFYLRLVSESPLAEVVDTTVGHVIYVAKSYGKWDHEAKSFSPFKEYEVKAEDDGVDALREKGDQYGQYQETGKLPPRICPHAGTKRAQKCAVRKECFSC